MDNKKEKAIVIGAGPGGLTAAMILSSKGYDVHIYEKMDRVGGRNSKLTMGEFSFDVGPTFLMMKEVLDEVFALAGEKSDDHFNAIKLDPMYSLYFDDRTLEITQDRAKLQAQIDQHFPGNEGSLERFLETEGKRFEKIYPILKNDYSSFKNFFSPIFLRTIPYIQSGKSIFDQLGTYFNDEKLRLAFTFQSKYLGMSPWECPGLFVILPFLEHYYGVYHVEGGLNQISEGMARVIRKNGGTIHLDSNVKEIMTKGKKATGIQLEDGTIIDADHVIINADFAWAAHNLFKPGVLKANAPAKIAKKEYSCSTYMVYITLDTVYKNLPHHSIVFASEYRTNIEDIFKRYKLTEEDFSFYVRNDAVTDKTTAPEGKSGLYCLVPVPNQKSGTDWKAKSSEMYNNLISALKERLGLDDVEQHILDYKIITPDDWEKDYNVHIGAVFGMSHKLSQLLYLRPHNQLNELDNCYLVGGNTHPGSGLPTIYESGRIACDCIFRKKK